MSKIEIGGEEMKYKFFGGEHDGLVLVRDEVEEIGDGRYTDDLTELREKGRCVHRAELDNQPLVPGYVGPMWDGDCLRYETQEVYNMLSR